MLMLSQILSADHEAKQHTFLYEYMKKPINCTNKRVLKLCDTILKQVKISFIKNSVLQSLNIKR